MSLRFPKRLRLVVGGLAVLAVALSLAGAYFARPAQQAKAAAASMKPFCSARPQLCTETIRPLELRGTVHRPRRAVAAVLLERCPDRATLTSIISRLPNDPPTPPNDNGTGGTWNFQLHPAFWFGMAHVRRPVGAQRRWKRCCRPSNPLHARQRQEHLRQHQSELGEVHGQDPRNGVHGDAVLSAWLGKCG